MNFDYFEGFPWLQKFSIFLKCQFLLPELVQLKDKNEIGGAAVILAG